MDNDKRSHSFIDHLVLNFDQALRTIANNATASRPNPAITQVENNMSMKELRHSAGLIRVDHTGEVCAQALYQGQALTAQTSSIKKTLQQSALEENDHLAWCSARLRELHSHTSYLNPAWYFASLFIGMVAGACGDRWNLGFVNETEQQVVRHLNKHLEELPKTDAKSRAILAQMQLDEAHHANVALTAGAADLPLAVKILMRLFAKVMTTTAYYV